MKKRLLKASGHDTEYQQATTSRAFHGRTRSTRQDKAGPEIAVDRSGPIRRAQRASAVASLTRGAFRSEFQGLGSVGRPLTPGNRARGIPVELLDRQRHLSGDLTARHYGPLIGHPQRPSTLSVFKAQWLATNGNDECFEGVKSLRDERDFSCGKRQRPII